MRRSVVLLATMTLMVVLASGLALAVTQVGGPGKDKLEGTDEPDWLDGAGGKDKIDGEGGDDSVTGFDQQGMPVGGLLIGGLGDDKIDGGGGDDDLVGSTLEEAIAITRGEPIPYEPDNGRDVLDGGDGEDVMFGGGGPDKLYGGDDDDELADGENVGGARDILSGGDGDDFFLSFNEPAVEDEIKCGKGYDTVYGDREDDIKKDCEKKIYRNPAPGEVCVRCDNANDDGKGDEEEDDKKKDKAVSFLMREGA